MKRKDTSVTNVITKPLVRQICAHIKTQFTMERDICVKTVATKQLIQVVSYDTLSSITKVGNIHAAIVCLMQQE